MLKFLRVPFAQSGDRATVPDAVVPGGDVSYTEGYGVDYARPKTDPLSKNIEREKMNQVFFDATTAIGELQAQGVPDFITTVLNGGTAYSYAKNAFVRWTDGELYMSLVAANTATPADRTKWALVGIDLTIVRGDGATDNTAAVQAANARGLPILFIGISVIGGATTITVPIVDIVTQMFTTGSLITIDNGLPVRPEWWGAAAGNIMFAVNALPTSGGEVRLRKTTYPPSYNTFTAAKFIAGTNVPGVDYLAKRNVRIQGSQLPIFKPADYSQLEDGTIIQGPFYVNADGFSIDLVGVDSGTVVTNALYAGAEKDGLVIGQVSQPSPVFMKNITIGKVRGLARGPAALVHGILIEAITEGRFDFMEGANAFHAAVIKSSGLRGRYIGGYEANGESVIFKSDSYAPMGNLQVDEVYGVNGLGVTDPGFGFLIDAVTVAGSSIQVGKVRVVGKANGVCVRSNGAFLTDVNIDSVLTESCAIGILFSGDVRRCNINAANLNVCTFGVQVEAGVTSPSNSIGSLKVVTATDGLNMQGLLSVGRADFEAISGFCVNYTATTARLQLGAKRFGPSVAAFWNQQPALSGAWVNEGSAGSPPFTISQTGARITMDGWVKSGAAAALTTLTTQTRPTSNRKFKAAGLNGATENSVTVIINASTGAVTIPDFASAPTYISLDGIEWDAP